MEIRADLAPLALGLGLGDHPLTVLPLSGS